jgi:hypothetical protein
MQRHSAAVSDNQTDANVLQQHFAAANWHFAAANWHFAVALSHLAAAVVLMSAALPSCDTAAMWHACGKFEPCSGSLSIVLRPAVAAPTQRRASFCLLPYSMFLARNLHPIAQHNLHLMLLVPARDQRLLILLPIDFGFRVLCFIFSEPTWLH